MNEANTSPSPSAPAEESHDETSSHKPISGKSRAYKPIAIVCAGVGVVGLILAGILGYAGIDVQTPTGLEGLASFFVGLLILASIAAFGIAIFLLVLSKRQ